MSEEICHKFSCVIVGSGTLPVRCGEILLSDGHEICAVVSSDEQVSDWASENNIVQLFPSADLAAQLREKPFDYLFSIVNEHILREDVLTLPRKLAVNYHDAPLPKYAGTHATSWALLSGEKSHGISWHIITDVVDAGDILQQKFVEINDHDTALTLNTKCYEAALETFARLVEELAAGTISPKKQFLSERTFFPRFKRPSNGGVISWNKTAFEISALVRALDFGLHPNPLGSAKLFVGDEFFIISEVEILDKSAKNAPGTITKIGTDFLQISAADRELILRKILRLDGQIVSITDLAAKFNLAEGFRLTELDAKTARRLDEFYPKIARHEKFWTDKLLNLEPAAPPLVNDKSLSKTIHFETAPMPIPEEVLSFLNERQINQGEFLITAFGVLLARLNGVESFDVGYKNAARQNEISGLPNFFADWLPLRFEVDFLQSFGKFSETVKQQTELLEKHQTFAQDILKRYPQFHKSIASGNNFTLPTAIETVKKFDDYNPTKDSELTLLIAENETECRLIYNAAKIKDVEKIVCHFAALLKSIAADPEGKIAQMPLLTEAEQAQILFEWNDNRAEYPKNLCIHQLFETQVSRTPEATALIFGEQHLTYRELNNRANRVAHYLQNLGVKPETLVGICVARSVEMIVGILGILKAGGAYIPLDPNYPAERLALMLEDSQVSVLLTQENLIPTLESQHAEFVCLDTDWAQIASQSKENPVSKAETNNLAYVIYTSGSTGKPKGVAIEHRSASAFLHWATTVFSAEQLAGVLASTSVCFDLSVFEMFTPLASGGAIILVENVLHLPESAAANEVTLINSVPSAITELLRIKGVPTSVKTVNLAGEPLKTSLVKQIYELDSVKQVFDLYGPTEDTTYSTFTLRDDGAATIGRPISNTQTYILDKFLQPVPAGIPGELYLGGDGLARGYLNQTELTNERFIKNPFSEDSTARMYRTGDLVRYLHDGRIEYLGRIDNQVKIRGFRIELGEIETVLANHTAVSEAVVIAVEDQSGAKNLAAYFVPNLQSKAKIAELRDYLKQKLPDYMIPSFFTELDELPLTPNGKINRKALPAPSANLPSGERKVVSHRDELERQLTEIWETILGVQPIGIGDNFFEMGGHSLKAVRMFVEVEKTFGKNIPLATLFEAGTIEKLAEILRQDGWSAPESSLVPIQTEGTKPIFFCVHAKGGNVLFYRDLARHLGKDQPFYGIQARRLGGRQIGHGSVAEMAEFYIKEMRTIQPEGPYFLGGASFGGLAAFEIVQQLCAVGEKVALVALFDTGTPDYPKLLPNTTVFKSKFYEIVRRIQHHAYSLRMLDSEQRKAYLLNKKEGIRRKYARKIRNAYKRIARRFYAANNQPMPKNLIQLEDQIWRAGQNYAPQFYSGKVTLFRASNQPLGIYEDPTLGWKNLVDELEIHEVSGHHGSITAEPYVRNLAKKLCDCLAEIQTEEQIVEKADKVKFNRARKVEFEQV
jgi:amino acid adenylation domain-containing protein